MAARPPLHETRSCRARGLVEVAEESVPVTGLKGPLEQGWQQKVEAFVARIPLHR